MSDTKLNQEDSLPKRLFALGEQLGLSNKSRSEHFYLELSGAVLSQYLVGQQARLQALLSWFYQTQGFKFDPNNALSAQGNDLGYVLKTRSGSANSLALLLYSLSKQLDLPTYILNIPGQMVLAAKFDEEIIYINPTDGSHLTVEEMHKWVKGELGNSAEFKSDYLQEVEQEKLFIQMVQELKGGFALEQQFEGALVCSDIQVNYFPDQPLLKRERAFFSQQVGAYSAAADDLDAVLKASPNDPLSETIKQQLNLLRKQSPIIH